MGVNYHNRIEKSWQIVPAILGELMSNPEKSKKVIEIFLQMTKFDIQKLINA